MRTSARRLPVLLLVALYLWGVLMPLGAGAAAAPAPLPGPGPSGAPVAAAGGRYPVVVIPGLAGSELWNGGELVWLNLVRGAQSQIPILNWWSYDWLLPLRLRPDGQTSWNPADRVRVGSALHLGPVDLYGGFLDGLEQQGWRVGRDLFVYPYDWRKGVAEAAQGLAPVVERALAQNPGAGKVVLVGHSLGGLVAREYVRATAGARVAALVGVGTPWLGAALPYKALERGWDLGIRIPGTPWSVRAPRTLHLLVQNYPSVYQLLPGRHYQAVYGGFARQGGQAVPHERARAEIIAPHNPLLAQGMGYVDTLLDGNAYGVLHFLIAGHGADTMVAAEQGEWFGFPTWDEVQGAGDDTVPLYSADAGAGRDPQLPARLLGRVGGIAYVRSTHAFLMTNAAVANQVGRWLAAVQPQGARR